MSKRKILFVIGCILLIIEIACICTFLFQKEHNDIWLSGIGLLCNSVALMMNCFTQKNNNEKDS